jgi:hypothetical protein
VSKIQEALDEFAMAERSIAISESENDGYSSEKQIDECNSAKSAVLSLFSEREALCKELAEALDISKKYWPCTGCYMREAPVSECIVEYSCTLADDWRHEFAQINAALAHYQEAEK